MENHHAIDQTNHYFYGGFSIVMLVITRGYSSCVTTQFHSRRMAGNHCIVCWLTMNFLVVNHWFLILSPSLTDCKSHLIASVIPCHSLFNISTAAKGPKFMSARWIRVPQWARPGFFYGSKIEGWPVDGWFVFIESPSISKFCCLNSIGFIESYSFI